MTDKSSTEKPRQPAQLQHYAAEIATVVLAGLFGGLIGLVYERFLGQAPDSGGLVTAAAYAALGAGAAVIGIYLLAQTDSKHYPRFLAVAFFCGVFWKPVFDAGSALASQIAQERTHQVITEHAEELEQLIALLGASPTEAQSEQIKDIAVRSSDLIMMLPQASDFRVLRNAEAKVESATRALGDVRGHDDEVLTSLAVMARRGIDTRQAHVTRTAGDVMVDRAARMEREDPEVTERTRRILEEISHDARIRRDVSLEIEIGRVQDRFNVEQAGRLRSSPAGDSDIGRTGRLPQVERPQPDPELAGALIIHIPNLDLSEPRPLTDEELDRVRRHLLSIVNDGALSHRLQRDQQSRLIHR